MRVVGGQARGVELKTARAPHLRPTSDRVRGAIFSMLEARTVRMERVLDLYAGTGALGIEALSRGAAWADFVERDSRLCMLIRENLSLTRFAGQAAVHAMPVSRALQALSGPYDLVLMDPPYAEAGALAAVISTLLSSDLTAERSTLVVEQGSRATRGFTQTGLRLLQQKTYGDTAISLYAVQGLAPNDAEGRNP